MNGPIQPLNDLLTNYGIYQDFIIKAIFYSAAGLSCAFALLVVTARNVFHSAIFLALTLIGVACTYLFLDAEFLAIIQILIYVGAIVTLFIFAIMLTSKIQDKSIKQTNSQVVISVIVALGLLFSFIAIISKNPWAAYAEKAQKQNLDLATLGRHLMSTYALPFELISLILLAALVGAIVIGKVKE